MNMMESSTNSEVLLHEEDAVVVDVDEVAEVVLVVVVEDGCVTKTIFPLQHSQVCTGEVPIVIGKYSSNCIKLTMGIRDERGGDPLIKSLIVS